MPLSLTHAVGSGVINTADIESNVDKLETYINGGTNANDYSTDWVESTHVRPPEFFGAPAPRTELVSSDVHFRKAGTQAIDAFRLWADIDQTNFVPITNLAATIHVMPPGPGDTVTATVLCNWYCREISFGKDDLAVTDTGNMGKYVFGTFGLFVKRDDSAPQYQVGSMRQIHASGDLRISAQNYSLATKVTLQTGINHVYVGAKLDPDCPGAKAYRLWVGPRSFIVDVHYV